jgi:predicted GH43/DUF377 family glycosyl hydrolase
MAIAKLARESLFTRHPSNPIITAEMLPYSANSVFNPAAAEINGETMLLMRVEDLRGLSHLTIARSADGITDWKTDSRPALVPDPKRYPEEIWGVEDPRVTWLPELERWAVAYVAFGRGGPMVSLATTKDFNAFRRLGPVMPPDDKDAALFPYRFNGRWGLIHRTILPRGGAHIWLSYSPDLRHWGDLTLLLEAREGGWWDADKIGLGPPPLETPEGWLLMYHGVRRTASNSIYRVGLALLDLEDPRIVLRRSDEWVLAPHEDYEKSGDVIGVVFPCGWVLDQKTRDLRVYYGAADTSIALATANLDQVLDYLRSCPPSTPTRPFHLPR